MTMVESLLLGLVQGVSEFLPISSSGHLVVVKELLGIQPNLFFDVLLHLATGVAAGIFFREQILSLNKNQLLIILLASFPIGILGFLFRKPIEAAFSSLALVSITLMITGVINLISDHLISNQELEQKHNGKLGTSSESKWPNLKQGLIVGIFQTFALTVGISRSGSTIFGGLLSGLRKETAFVFSFLLLLPAVLGAVVIESPNIWSPSHLQALPEYLVGFIGAIIMGYISLSLLEKAILATKFRYFGYYCLTLGVCLIVLQGVSAL